MEKAYLLAGGNMGNREAWLAKARLCLEQECGKLLLASSIYETEAWGVKDQPAFLNQAFLLETSLRPGELLNKILEIETRLGRERNWKYGPRTIDIDILFYGEKTINAPGLIIPHPELHKRRFALVCLEEIAPCFTHPLLGKTISELNSALNDPLKVYKFN